jgi:hypothetical protein
MNTPLILVILAVAAVLLLLFFIRFYLKKNRQDLQKLRSALKDSKGE